jgi:16S rRNA (cytidine1402-2'-O)-methyltransferase
MKLFSNSLYIVSTPIGNLADITFRAVEVLKNSDIILCEDTRHSLKLLNHLKIKKKLISYHKFNERKKSLEVIEYINQGKILSLISDAGTPLLSDPGRLLVNQCIENNIKVVPIPGVSSITSAMSVSGFKDQYLFYGFLPKTENQLDKTLATLSENVFSQVFFIPALKINFYLKKFKKYFSGRKLLIARELTKIHEIFYRENIDDLKMFKNSIKGELTVVVSEKNIKKKRIKVINEKKIVNKAKKYLKKYSLKDTVDLILETENINKKTIYKLCLNIKNEKNF